MAKSRKPSAAVLAGRGRRAGRADVRIEWFDKLINKKIKMSMRQRVALATRMVRAKVVQNISTAVVKGKGPRGGRVVTGRSRPGEFPHAETENLMGTIFDVVQETRPGVWDGYIGTPLDYGIILEMRMNRSFLVRTLREERDKMKRILTGPIR